MGPENITPNNNFQNDSQQPLQTQPIIPSTTPNTPPKKKLFLWLILGTALIIMAILAGLYSKSIITKNDENASEQSQTTNSQQSSDKQGIQGAVNKYCLAIAESWGFKDMKSGYIISDRYSEDILGDSPELLRFKQVDDAASATVDCERSGQPMGISNDLLFVKINDSWSYVDEVQNNTNSGFLCSVVEQYNVSKELVGKCAPTAQSRTTPR